MSGAKDTNVEDEKIDVKTCEKELEPAINEESSTTEVLKNDTTAGGRCEVFYFILGQEKFRTSIL